MVSNRLRSGRTRLNLLEGEPQRELRRLVRVEGPAEYPDDAVRPKTRGDCVDGPRPCPWVSCRHHLFLEVSKTGGIKYNFPGMEPGDLAESCSLDVAERGGLTAPEVAQIMQVSPERVRQVQDGVEAIGKGTSYLGRFGVVGEVRALAEHRPEGKSVFRGVDKENEEDLEEEDEKVACDQEEQNEQR
jgi:hypothetical protein